MSLQVYVFRGERQGDIDLPYDFTEVPKLKGRTPDEAMVTVLGNLQESTQSGYVLFMKDSTIFPSSLESVNRTIGQIEQFNSTGNHKRRIGACMLASCGVLVNKEVSVGPELSLVSSLTCSQAFIMSPELLNSKSIRSIITKENWITALVNTLLTDSKMVVCRALRDQLLFDVSLGSSDVEVMNRANVYNLPVRKYDRDALIFKFAIILIIIIITAWSAYQVRRRFYTNPDAASVKRDDSSIPN
uniref:Uncharacterized protein n=1 Tax=viral metagenome TaxID=1070528 RepID=A0A6C0JSA5_9ZZZZ